MTDADHIFTARRAAKMRPCGLFVTAAGLLLGSAPAQACITAEDQTHAFTLVAPPRDADTVVAKLRILRVNDRKVEAVLVEPFDRAPGIDRVVVETSLRSSCAGWGPLQGEVYAVVTAPRVEGGTLYFYAPQREGPVYPPRRGRSRAELDSYIVDPAYRTTVQ